MIMYEFAMSCCTTVVSTWMVFVVLPLGMSCQVITLTEDGSTDSPASLTCGSRAVFVCTLTTPPSLYFEWLADGVSISTCTSNCITTGLPSHYSVTKNSGGTEYTLTIDTLKNDDNKTFLCKNNNGDISNTIDTTVSARFVDLTNDTTEAGNSVTSIATTNCLESPSNVQVDLKYKQEHSTSAFEDYSGGTSNRNVTTCTNAENPDCGGDTASKIITTMNIPTTKSGGDVYIFQLHVSENNVLVYQKELGRYRIKVITTTTESPPTPSLCEEFSVHCAMVIVTPLIGLYIVLCTSIFLIWYYFAKRPIPEVPCAYV